MDGSENSRISMHQLQFILSALLAAMAALLLDAFYIYIQYGQNPTDLHQPRVQF